MKVCQKCKKENNDESIYCTKCGTKIKKEVDLTKTVLLVGVFLVMFASIFFGILNWEHMEDIFRLLFFCFETCLFFIMSFALSKVSRVSSRIFFVIGLILTPFTLSMIPYYNLLPTILYNRALIFTYLAIIYLLTFGAYIAINIKFKGKILNYLSLLSLLISVVSFTLIFTENMVIVGLVITIYMLLVNISSKIFKNDSRIYYIFSLILSFILVPFLIICFIQAARFEMIINVFTLIVFMVDGYLKMLFNKNSVLHFFAPFMFQLLSFILANTLFGNNDILIVLVLSLGNIALYFITWLFKNTLFSMTTLVLTHCMLALLTLIYLIVQNNMIILIISSICLLFNLSLIVFKKYNFFHFLITVNVFFAVIALNNWLYNFESLIIVGFLLIVYLIIYLILNLINNKYDFIYLIIMMLIGAYAGLSMLYELSGFSVIKLIICVTFLIGFILVNIFKEHAAIRIIWYIVLNILLLPLFGTAYYSALAISMLTIFVGFILGKATEFNFKPHILYAEILIFIITLTNSMQYNLFSLFINIVAFILGYLCLIKFHNKKAWRIAYVMVGLLYLTKLISVVVEPVVISSLISIIIILILITAMYLLDTYNSKELVIISLVALIPYYALVGAINPINPFSYYYNYYESLTELYLVPFTVYAIVLLFVIKWKSEGARNVFILIPFFVIGALFLLFNTGVVSTIIDVVYAVTYIILGLIKKYNLLVFFAIGFLIFSILVQLFTVLNSMMAIVALLIVGFILIFVAVLYSTKKKD